MKKREEDDSLSEYFSKGEDLYHSLFDNVHDGIYRSSGDGKILTANPALVKMLGYDSEEELKKLNIGKDIYVKPSERLSYVKQIEKSGTLRDVELILKRKDGSHIIVLENSHAVYNKSGKLLFYEGTLTNITALKQSEEQQMLFKHSIDVHFDGAYWMDTDNRFVYVNESACKACGYKKEELIGEHLSILNPNADEKKMDLVWQVLRKEGSFTIESEHHRKDGTRYPVEIVSSYVIFAGREYNCGFARDITDRKRAARNLNLHLEQLRQIIDLVPSYIFAKDIDGKFLLANKALANVFGLSPDEIQGKNDSDYGATKEQVEWYRKADLEVIRKGIPLFIPEENVLRADGTLGWFQTVKIPYKHPGYEKPAILGVATDITERKEIEDELRISEKRFRKLFESHSAIKLMIDIENESITDANDAAAEFYGWSVNKLRKMSIYDLNTEDKKIVKDRFEKAIKAKNIYFETRHLLADGTIKDVEVFSSKIDIDGKYYLHSIIHDITEKKKILADLIAAKEKAEISDGLKTAFLHNISHEVRTPMNAIVGFTTLLETPGLPDETRQQYIDIVFKSSNQLLSIISDIVDISNIETGHIKLSETRVNINNLILNLFEQYKRIAEVSHLSFRYRLALEDDKSNVITDETKLMQVLSNLINNSLKFTREGSVEFGYQYKGNKIEFYVKDTGIGIDSLYKERIFDRFYQIDHPAKNKTEGTGLGLSICKAYVELLGGEIGVKSKPGKGSLFYFTIPFKK